MLVAIECDALPGYGGSFEKVGHRRSLVISLVCLAALVKLDRAGTQDRGRAAGDRRHRTDAHAPERGRNISLRRTAQPRAPRTGGRHAGDLVASRTRQEYRREVVRGFMLRGLINAVRRAGADPARPARPSWRPPMPDLQFEATINGRKIARRAKPHQRLLDFLRDDLNLTGNKEGCGAGECGTCSVFVDGVLMKSCLMPVAKAQDATIETVEGLATNRRTDACCRRRFTRRAPANAAIAFPAW